VLTAYPRSEGGSDFNFELRQELTTSKMIKSYRVEKRTKRIQEMLDPKGCRFRQSSNLRWRCDQKKVSDSMDQNLSLLYPEACGTRVDSQIFNLPPSSM
jgi:hypothetical protein